MDIKTKTIFNKRRSPTEKSVDMVENLSRRLRVKEEELKETRAAASQWLRELEIKNIELDNSRKALMNILEDVEKAREKAEEETERTLAIVTNFADGLLVFDLKNTLSLINPQAEKLFNVKNYNLIGKIISELMAVPNLKPLVELLGPEIKETFRKELSVGEGLTLEVSALPVIRGGERSGVLVILHDITREKTIEKMKGEFVSLAAHQLRTPLSAIKWTLKMILDGDVGEVNKDQRGILQKSYESNERMINLINDLLDVTRIEEGRYLYRVEPNNLEDIVRFVLDSYQNIIKRNNLKLVFKKPTTKLPQVSVDGERMKLAIQNLLDNAIKYTKSGGKIIITLKRVKNEVEFMISDNGIGIPQEQQKRVFNKFFRGPNALRMEAEGSGLGLFITQNIIKAHNGKIRFESREGKGTTFYFDIPIVEEFADFLKKF